MSIPVATLPPDQTPPPPQEPAGVPAPPPLPSSGGAAAPGPSGANLPQSPGGAPGAADAPPADAGGGAPAGDDGAPAPAQPPGSASPQGSADPKPRLIPGTDATSGNVPASPQEQADLRQVMVKAGNMIHGKASRDAVLNSLHQPDKTVAEAVGQTAAQILMTINSQAKAVTKAPLDNDVLREAARYLIPELMDIGISAGILPIQKPAGEQPDNGHDQGPGVGTDDYNKQLRMAMLEATKMYGESLLRQPGAQQLSAAAGDMWALGVRKEMADGTADPRFKQAVQARNTPSAGASLVPPTQGAPGAGAPPGGAPPA